MFGLICHRIVDGGDCKDYRTMTAETRCCFKLLSKSRNVKLRIEQFHKTILNHIATYAINQEVASRNGGRKYGFHALSYTYAYMTRQMALHLGKDMKNSGLHCIRGSGASVCAIKNSGSWDTSNGLDPCLRSSWRNAQRKH